MKLDIRFVIVWSLQTSLFVTGAARAQTPTTTRASLDSYGGQANAHSDFPAISADGRVVAFHTPASNLVDDETNGFDDVFVHDRQSGMIERVSIATNGTQGNGSGANASLSADGSFVAFVSSSSNLVASDTNFSLDIFVHDRPNRTTTRVSVDSTGAQANNSSSVPSISGDGRFVAFRSLASNLVAGDTNATYDIFVHDRTTGTTERVSVNSAGVQANVSNTNPVISGDGMFVAFQSFASNLVVGDTNGLPDVFVRDRAAGTTERVSIATNGAQGDQGSGSFQVSISADGRVVAFMSGASNLVAGDTNGIPDVFIHDRATATTDRVNVSTAGAQANSPSYNAVSISGDGRFVAFESQATNLVALDTNNLVDIFVHDRVNATTERVSLSTAGTQGNGAAMFTAISGDGRYVAFSDTSTNLVAGDTNGGRDVFVCDRIGLPVTYCTSGTTSNGCSATITASANPSLSSAHACTVQATSVDGQRSGLVFYGVNNSGFESRPFATGSTSWLCVQPPTQRTPIQTSGGTFGACDGSFALDWNAYQSANPLALGNPWSLNTKVYVQAWFRDPLAVKTSSLSNLLELTYVP